MSRHDDQISLRQMRSHAQEAVVSVDLPQLVTQLDAVLGP
jgi:hypothetical protein